MVVECSNPWSPHLKSGYAPSSLFTENPLFSCLGFYLGTLAGEDLGREIFLILLKFSFPRSIGVSLLHCLGIYVFVMQEDLLSGSISMFWSALQSHRGSGFQWRYHCTEAQCKHPGERKLLEFIRLRDSVQAASISNTSAAPVFSL